MSKIRIAQDQDNVLYGNEGNFTKWNYSYEVKWIARL